MLKIINIHVVKDYELSRQVQAGKQHCSISVSIEQCCSNDAANLHHTIDFSGYKAIKLSYSSLKFNDIIKELKKSQTFGLVSACADTKF